MKLKKILFSSLSICPLFFAFLGTIQQCSANENAAIYSQADIEKAYAKTSEKWEKAMAYFDKLTPETKQSPDNILFIGSSSIRHWPDISKDMAPFLPIQRGFGGSKWSDIAVYIDRIIKPHSYKAVVFFVGNSIAGKKEDKTPEEVFRLIQYCRERVLKHNPKAHIFVLSVTPTPARFKVYPTVQKAHQLQQEWCKKLGNTTFIDTESAYLDEKKQPIPELFVKDRLHFNQKGYDIWSAIIKKHLSKQFP